MARLQAAGKDRLSLACLGAPSELSFLAGHHAGCPQTLTCPRNGAWAWEVSRRPCSLTPAAPTPAGPTCAPGSHFLPPPGSPTPSWARREAPSQAECCALQWPSPVQPQGAMHWQVAMSSASEPTTLALPATGSGLRDSPLTVLHRAHEGTRGLPLPTALGNPASHVTAVPCSEGPAPASVLFWHRDKSKTLVGACLAASSSLASICVSGSPAAAVLVQRVVPSQATARPSHHLQAAFVPVQLHLELVKLLDLPVVALCLVAHQ